jgi:hypothetical protein
VDADLGGVGEFAKNELRRLPSQQVKVLQIISPSIAVEINVNVNVDLDLER